MDLDIRWNAAEQNGRTFMELLGNKKPKKDPFRYFYSPEAAAMSDLELFWDVDEYETICGVFISEINAVLRKRGQAIEDDFGHVYFCEGTVGTRVIARRIGKVFDRTLEIFAGEVSVFDAELICCLQRRLLQQFPLWRIHVAGAWEDGEPSITIYTDCIWVGETRCIENDIVPRIREWQQTIMVIRSVMRRHHTACRRVRANLQGRLPGLDRNVCHLLDVFDFSWGHDGNELGCWVLHPQSPSRINILRPERPSVTPVFWIDDDGCVSRLPDDYAPYREVCVYGISRDCRRELELEEKPTGRTWKWEEFEITPLAL